MKHHQVPLSTCQVNAANILEGVVVEFVYRDKYIKGSIDLF